MLKTLAAVATILGTVAIASADRGPSKKTDLSLARKPALGTSYDLPRRDHAKSLPQEVADAQKFHPLTLAQVASVARLRHEEIAYCWDRLPPSQRTPGTAIMKFSIEPSGAVAAVDITGDAPDAAVSCLSDCAKRWMFPATDAGTEIDYPITLR